MNRETLARFYIELTHPDVLGITDPRLQEMHELAIKGLEACRPEALPFEQAEELQFTAKGLLAMMTATFLKESGITSEEHPEEWALLGLCLQQMECFDASIQHPDTITIWKRITDFLNRPRPSTLSPQLLPTEKP